MSPNAATGRYSITGTAAPCFSPRACASTVGLSSLCGIPSRVTGAACQCPRRRAGAISQVRPWSARRPGAITGPDATGATSKWPSSPPPPGVFDGDDPDDEELGVRGFIYSSEMKSWSEVNPIPDLSEQFGELNCVLIGHSVYFMSDGLTIFEFDLEGSKLSVIPSPDIGESLSYNSRDEDRVILMVTEDGGLGMAEGLDGVLHFWSWETTGGSIGTWVETESLDAYDICLPADRFDLIGFAEGANTIFMRVSGGIFTYELSSRQGRTVLGEAEDCYCIFPVVSFYATHNVLQGPEEKALELAQRLFNRGSNSIEQMDFVNAVHSFSQSLDIRVGHYGKLAAECATTYYKYGCALLYKAQSVTDCIGNVHKETSNDESVKSEYHDEASGTNAEDAPSLEKVNSDED